MPQWFHTNLKDTSKGKMVDFKNVCSENRDENYMRDKNDDCISINKD